MILPVNPFVSNARFLYPLKTSENRKVFLMFSGGREKVHWKQMGKSKSNDHLAGFTDVACNFK